MFGSCVNNKNIKIRKQGSILFWFDVSPGEGRHLERSTVFGLTARDGAQWTLEIEGWPVDMPHPQMGQSLKTCKKDAQSTSLPTSDNSKYNEVLFSSFLPSPPFLSFACQFGKDW